MIFSDLLFPSQSDERRKHKLKRLIQAPNSFFMDVKCPGCFHITTVFSHAQVRIKSPPFFSFHYSLHFFVMTAIRYSEHALIIAVPFNLRLSFCALDAQLFLVSLPAVNADSQKGAHLERRSIK
jgi:phage FluMu protein Com